MIKKLRQPGTLKQNGNYMFDFISGLNIVKKVKQVNFENKTEQKNFNKLQSKSSFVDKENFNDKVKIKRKIKNFEISSTKNYLKDLNCDLNSLPTRCNSSFDKKLVSKSLNNNNNNNKFSDKIKSKKIEFFDEYNRRFIKRSLFNEENLELEIRMVLPKVKPMKIDNDVMTDDEQMNDALDLMDSNLRSVIKSINNDKNYLKNNLSRRMKK